MIPGVPTTQIKGNIAIFDKKRVGRPVYIQLADDDGRTIGHFNIPHHDLNKIVGVPEKGKKLSLMVQRLPGDQSKDYSKVAWGVVH
jgi:hypothetical protein